MRRAEGSRARGHARGVPLSGRWGIPVAAALATVGLVSGGSSAATSHATAHPSETNGQLVIGRYDKRFDDTVLYTLNPDGSHLRKVVDKPFECPHWSPDGSLISTCGTGHGNGTALIDPDTGHVRDLRMPDPKLFIGCPVWSPDGARLACEGWSKKGSKLTGLYTARSSDGRDRQRLTANKVGGHDIPGSYSPDGRQIVFSREYHSEDTQGLFTVGTDGSDLRRLVPGWLVSSSGDWSAQSSPIVFSRHVSPRVHSSIWVVGQDGTGLRRITPSAKPDFCGGLNSDRTARGCTSPVWSPDGTKIAFLREAPGGSENLWTMDADGSHVRRIALNAHFVDWGTHPLSN